MRFESTWILLRSGLCTDEADRALQTAADLLAQGHTVSLYLLQEAVRFCGSAMKCSNSTDLGRLTDKNLEVHVLKQDVELRGIDGTSVGRPISEGSYE